ncbi:cytochrome c3 family protein [Ramlibacter sp. AN1133]|uniref:cytochrome c3 family protein n=1 Tax=Ramlibacter sp. AN1133 TaxID=3133429 RepID=UPI0030C08A3C
MKAARLATLILLALLALAAWLAPAGPAAAKKVPDISNTRHNLSASGPGTVKATTESQICVFCHTPHNAEAQTGAPLWNRQLNNATYAATYSSSSIEANVDELAKGPGGLSRLCLSCHDGTMAIGNVNVLGGKANVSIAMTGTGPGGTMPPGAGTTSGFTRNLGTDLSNDHPISFTYDSALATADGELRAPDGTVVGTRVRGQPKPKLPLENGQLQCTTCHDPHLKEDDPTKPSAKFLRLNRLQETATAGAQFSETGDIICLACHDKGGQEWALSAHANSQVADEQFLDAAAAQREFPTGLPVWRAACLSCHDTHTVQGARRLLREGTDSLAKPKAGGNSAIEETCYQCHSATGETILQTTTQVPNIKTDFALATHMPITSTDQRVAKEVHDIGTGSTAVGGTQRGKDFYEDPALLGRTTPANRHVECTDCHNPHRVIKNRVFNGNAAVPDTAGTHNHAAGHTNIASGVLRGSYGVEPVYGGAAFGTPPSSFDVKRGIPGPSNAAGSAWVTREYQVCLKCHSTYAYTTPPNLGNSGGGTASGTNSVTRYTDQSMEFQPPHPGTASRSDSGAYRGLRPGCATTNAAECGTGACSCRTTEVNWQTGNWRAWHPVIAPTGRTIALRNVGTNAWKWPWNNDVGTQSMYCSDCHGTNTPTGTVDPNCTANITNTTVNPNCGDNGRPWGPHGSTNNFILKGEWAQTTSNNTANALCLKCHNPTTSSAFSGGGRGNLHAYHSDKIGRIQCTWCHIAVPHGWKNRSFLVNLNDVGPEVGLPPGTQVRNNTGASYTNGPYYLNALLKIRTFGTSGNWSDTNCGSSGAPGNGASGRSWMRDSSENCANPP